MAKDSTFVCSACGAVTSKWSGRCESCGEWNTIEETAALSSGPKKASLGKARGAQIPLTDLATEEKDPPRTLAGVGELDRVLGGGLVKASALLLGGDPGIGKSTLLLQAAARFARNGLKVIYVSGEESRAQVLKSPIWRSSIRSRRCGRIKWTARPDRSVRCAHRRMN